MSDDMIPASRPRALRIGDPAPGFRARTTMGDFDLASHRGRWVLLFSHPGDFTPVCTSEFVALARAAPRFEALGCALVALSVDGLFSHLAWVRAIREHWGITVPFPIIEDPSSAIGCAYGMLEEGARDAATVRATFCIDPDGIVRAQTWYPMSVGRSVEEMLRMLAALRRTADGEVLAPEGWRPGEDVLLPPTQMQEGALADDDGQPWFHRTRPDRP